MARVLGGDGMERQMGKTPLGKIFGLVVIEYLYLVLLEYLYLVLIEGIDLVLIEGIYLIAETDSVLNEWTSLKVERINQKWLIE